MFAIVELFALGSPNDTANIKRLLRDTFVEFVATTLFVNAGTLSAASISKQVVAMGLSMDVSITLPIAMAFGVSIMVLAYSIGHITGGHMNPGVSLLMFFRRQISIVKMLFYWVAQFSGGLVGAAITWGCVSNMQHVVRASGNPIGRPPFNLGATTLDPQISTANGFLLEFMGSTFFYFVIAQTALDKRGIAATSFPAIPIGFSLIVVHICLIPYTGCGVNPARTLGPSMVTCMGGGDCSAVAGSWYWIYFVGPFLAAWFVAELTHLMQMDVGEADEAAQENLEADALKVARIEKTKTDEMESPVEEFGA